MKRLIIINIMIIFYLTGCTPAPTKKPKNYYSLYLQHMPTSILILPPANHSMEVMAPYMYLSTITQPVAEKGYYVYPVAVIDALMKENGLTSPEEMHQIPLKKIKEIIDPDAVLYLSIKEWGTKYKLIDSQTIIQISAKLVDTDSGYTIWKKEQRIVKSSTDNADSIEQMLIAALLNQVISNFIDPTLNVAHKLNQNLFYNAKDGLLLGQHHPQYQENQKHWRQQKQ
jgi:hypothetical protein